ncbi:MAG: SCO family protein [Gammaproteobacteria bacterium]|nr:SCO family protein [Gammaproteobacteria bacterium]
MNLPMESGRRSAAINYAALLVSLMLLLGAGQAQGRSGGEVWGKDYFPNYELTAHTGEKLRFFDDMIAGKVVAVNFIFTSCTDVCPMETARMASVYDLLGGRVGKDVHFYSITIDPENDTAEVLRDYAKRYGIDGKNWKFLTGNKQEIDHIRDKFGLYSTPAEEADLSNHNINLMIGNQATGQWMRRSPFENPYILANQLGTWLHGWKTASNHTEKDYAKAPKLRQISSGEMFFRDRCSSCHVISGGIAPVRSARQLGPDLFAVGERRDPAWLRRWMKEPDKMLEEGDPIAAAMYEQYKVIMPNFRLDQGQIEMLIDYMAEETERLRSRRLAAIAQSKDASHQHSQHKHHDHGDHQHHETGTN